MTGPLHDNDPRIEAALAQVQGLLITGETAEAWAIQLRLFALTNRRQVVVATSGRLLAFARRLIGGFDLTEVRWQDLKEARIRVGIFAAEVGVTVYDSTDLASGASSGRVLKFGGLRKDQAQAVYRICQTHEQAWREKRRIRELEEMRARAGGVHIAAPGAPSVMPPDAPPDAGGTPGDPLRRLQDAKNMLDAGLITDSEFQAIKAKIVSGL